MCLHFVSFYHHINTEMAQVVITFFLVDNEYVPIPVYNVTQVATFTNMV